MTQRVKTLFTATLAVAVSSFATADGYRDEVRAAVEQLGADEEKARDAAREALRELGPAALQEMTREDIDGDPERRVRIRELMSEWGYATYTERDNLPEPRRVAPWDSLTEFGSESLSQLHDVDVLPEIRRRLTYPGGDRLVCLEWLSREDVTVSDEVILELLRDFGGRILYPLLRRPRWSPQGRLAELLSNWGGIGASEGTSSAHAWAFLRFGPGNDLIWSSLKPDLKIEVPRVPEEVLGVRPENDARLLLHLREHAPEEAARCFHRVEFAGTYLAATDWNALVDLESPPRDEALLAFFVIAPSPEVRSALAVRLIDSGIPCGGLDLEALSSFEGNALLVRSKRLREALLSLTSRLTGPDSENLLRDAIRSADKDAHLARSLLLRVLCERDRDKDVTFVWSHLKTLPESLQPEVAVSLARLGSSAGIGLMLPHLTAFDCDLRRDAGNALRRITGLDFGYDPLASLRDRCIAARQWKLWWKENRTSFSPDRAKIR